jgi:hypothetical protein
MTFPRPLRDAHAGNGEEAWRSRLVPRGEWVASDEDCDGRGRERPRAWGNGAQGVGNELARRRFVERFRAL